jgi:uncharacterized protein (UPF0276 family)
MTHNDIKTPTISGVGLGLRSNHYQEILTSKPNVPWFELLADNYMEDGGLPIERALKIRQDYPLTLHCVGMSLGSCDPLNMEYLTRLKTLSEKLQPTYISDHLAWTSINNKYTHELLPLPYNAHTLNHLCERIEKVQEFLGRTLLIENPSSYLTFEESDISEWEFISQMAKISGCDLLVDINNIYVSSVNHQFDPFHYIASLPEKKVKEIHLAGFTKMDNYLLDSHSEKVHPPVWDLYRAAIKKFGATPTLIEWDSDIPDFSSLYQEALKAESHMRSVTQ